MKLTIYIDMDETLVNLVDPWLEILNDKLGNGHKFTREHCDMYDMTSTIPLPAQSVMEPFHRPGFWENLPPLPGAVEFVRDIYNLGHKVYIATIPYRSDNCAWEKRLWVEEYLPFLNPDHDLILIRHKHLLPGDVIIDDNPELILKFKGVRILVDRPWNRDLRKYNMLESWFIRAHSWNRVREAIHILGTGANPYHIM